MSRTGASVIGQIVIGLLSDHISPWLLAFVTLSVASLAIFVLWGVVGNIAAGLFLFGAAYGLLAGGFSSLYTAFVKPIASECILRLIALLH